MIFAIVITMERFISSHDYVEEFGYESEWSAPKLTH